MQFSRNRRRRLAPAGEGGEHGRFYQAIERVWERTLAAYERSLRWVMDRRGLAMAFSGLILVGTVLLGRAVPKGFIPSEDQGQLFGDGAEAVETADEAPKPDRQSALERSVDAVRARFGPGAVGPGTPTSLPREGPGRPAR